MKSPVVINSTLVSRVFRISLNTRPISFFDTFDTAQISAAEKYNKLTAIKSVNIATQIVKSRVKWVVHMAKMKNVRLPKRTKTKKQGGCRKRGKPEPRWADCLKIDQKKAEEEEKWSDRPTGSDEKPKNSYATG